VSVEVWLARAHAISNQERFLRRAVAGNPTDDQEMVDIWDLQDRLRNFAVKFPEIDGVGS
jgi:hypothetical protein